MPDIAASVSSSLSEPRPFSPRSSPSPPASPYASCPSSVFSHSSPSSPFSTHSILSGEHEEDTWAEQDLPSVLMRLDAADRLRIAYAYVTRNMLRDEADAAEEQYYQQVLDLKASETRLLEARGRLSEITAKLELVGNIARSRPPNDRDSKLACHHHHSPLIVCRKPRQCTRRGIFATPDLCCCLGKFLLVCLRMSDTNVAELCMVRPVLLDYCT